MKKIFYSFLILFLAVHTKAEINIYVSPGGKDTNNGSIDKPVQSLSAARDLARQKLSINQKESVTILLMDGTYFIDKSIEFNSKDVYSAAFPLRIKPAPNAKPLLTGNKTIPSSDWKNLSAEARKRVHPTVNPDKLVELDLDKAGIQNIQSFPESFVTSWSSIDFFANGERMPVSQFPNTNQRVTPKNEKGWITCNGSKDERTFYFAEGGEPMDKNSTNELDLDGTKRSERWAKSIAQGHDLWLKGNFRVPWDPVAIKVDQINTTEKWIRFAVQPDGGMGSKYTKAVSGSNPVYRVGSGEETYYAINYLDEIDQPGEWAIDFKDKKLYFYPKKEINKTVTVIADNKQPLFKINGAANMRIENLNVDGNLGNGFNIVKSSGISVAGCNIQNITGVAIAIRQSNSTNIMSNDIHNIGSSGITLDKCGNLTDVKLANITIDNNHIYEMGELAFNGGIGLMECCGVTISHNLIHDSPKNGIENRNSINIIMEFNEMHNFALRSGDTGAVYSYGGWYTYGNVLRYNFVHHNVRTNGFYPDDGDSGDVMYGNIIQGNITAFMLGGGHDNLVYNNLVVDCQRVSIDNRGIARNYRLGTKYEKDLAAFHPDSDPWKSFGEKLKKEYPYKSKLWSEILTPEYQPEHPKNCMLKNNIFVKVGKISVAEQGTSVEVSGNTEIKTLEEAKFYDYNNLDLRSDNPTVLSSFPDLNTIFPKIGLYKNEFRKRVPLRSEFGGLKNRLELEGDKEDKLIFKN